MYLDHVILDDADAATLAAAAILARPYIHAVEVKPSPFMTPIFSMISTLLIAGQGPARRGVHRLFRLRKKYVDIPALSRAPVKNIDLHAKPICRTSA